ETLSTTLLHLSDNTDHESNDSENELPVNDESRGHTNQLSTTATPKFAGHCMNIALLEVDDKDESTNNQTFLSSLEYKLPDGIVIDLLQKNGIQEHANRYVTSLMDVLFKPEELLAMETKDIPKDERYIMLK
ncbi:unnamed protein product, partial [Rotaria sordida]